MEPFPGPGQCSLPSSPSAAWVGREDADSWEPGDWSQEVPSPPHPHARPHACARTGLSARAEVFTLVRRCGSKCLCQGYHRLCARASAENALENRGSSAQASPSPPAPLLQCVGLAEPDWPGGAPPGAPPTPFSWAVPAGAQYGGLHCSRIRPPRRVSVPFALRGGADKQGTISSSKRPQKQRDWMKQAVQSPWGVQKPLLSLEGVFLGRGAPLICGFHP